MTAVTISLDAALLKAIERHVAPRDREEVIADIRHERLAREAHSGAEAGKMYLRRVIASLQSGDDE